MAMKSLLTRAEIDRLVAILDDDAVHNPLSKAAVEFRTRFPPGPEAFRAGLSLAVLLVERLLSPPQRLIALFCIADVHLTSHDMLKDPFLQYLVLSTSKTIPLEAERHFALLLLRRLQSQIQQMSAVAFVSSFRESRPIVPEDLAEYEAAAKHLNVIPNSLNPIRSIAISDSISPFQTPQTVAVES